MRVSRIKMLLLALLAASLPSSASAQTGQIGSYSRPKTNNYPAFSPYLNLTRPGNSATNYYGIVRPQQDSNRAFEQIEQGTFVDPRFQSGGAVSPDGTSMPGMRRYYPDQTAGLQTGHPSTFFYYSHYYQFPNQQRGGGGSNGNSSFGRPATQALPFFTGSNGIIMPVNPAGANPLGGAFGNIQPTVPGQVITP